MTRYRLGALERRRLASLDPIDDATEIAHGVLAGLFGRPALVYALFSVAFAQQVAIAPMARILHRRGTGDILVNTSQRNDDSLVFFGTLLDHGPESPEGQRWIERMNRIHAHFPIRPADSLYTLATLTLGPSRLAAGLGIDLLIAHEAEALWQFWAAVARQQHIPDIPADRHELQAWATAYEAAEYTPSSEGREIVRALIDDLGQRLLPRPLRGYAPDLVAAIAPANLIEVHGLAPARPGPAAVVTAALRGYVAATPVRPINTQRSLAAEFGAKRYGPRDPEAVGYRGPRGVARAR